MEILRDPKGFIKREIRKLMELREPPSAIAMGIAIGIFWGFSPLWGLKTLASLFSAILLRANRVAALVTVSLHDVLLPIMPVVMKWEYDIGRWALAQFGVETKAMVIKEMHIKDFLKWTTFFEVGQPLIIGAFIFAVPCGVITYFIALPVFKLRQERRAAAERMKDEG